MPPFRQLSAEGLDRDLGFGLLSSSQAQLLVTRSDRALLTAAVDEAADYLRYTRRDAIERQGLQPGEQPAVRGLTQPAHLGCSNALPPPFARPVCNCLVLAARPMQAQIDSTCVQLVAKVERIYRPLISAVKTRMLGELLASRCVDQGAILGHPPPSSPASAL